MGLAMAEVGFGGRAKVLSWMVVSVPYSWKYMPPTSFEDKVRRLESAAWIPPRTSLWSMSPSLEPAMSTTKSCVPVILQSWIRNLESFLTARAGEGEMACPAQSSSTFAASWRVRQTGSSRLDTRSAPSVKHLGVLISPHWLTTRCGTAGLPQMPVAGLAAQQVGPAAGGAAAWEPVSPSPQPAASESRDRIA